MSGLFDDLIPSAKAPAGGLFDDLIPAKQEPAPFRDKREAVADAVDRIALGGDPAQVRDSFKAIGVTEAEIAAEARRQGLKGFDMQTVAPEQRPAGVKPMAPSSVQRVEKSGTQAVLDTLSRAKENIGQSVDVLANEAGLTSNELLSRQLAKRTKAKGAAVVSDETAEGQELISQAGKEGWGEALSAMWQNKGATAAMLADSALQSIPQGLVAGAAAAVNPFAGAGVAGAMSAATEYANTITDSLQEAGMNPADPESIKRFLDNPELMAKARESGVKRGLAVGLFDGISAGIGGKFLAAAMRAEKAAAGAAKSAIKAERYGVDFADTLASGRMMKAGALEAGTQMGLGAGGEAAAQLADKGEITDRAGILLEALAELPGGAAEVAGGFKYRSDKAAESAPVPGIAAEVQAAKERQSTPVRAEDMPTTPLAPEQLQAMAEQGAKDRGLLAQAAGETPEQGNQTPEQQAQTPELDPGAGRVEALNTERAQLLSETSGAAANGEVREARRELAAMEQQRPDDSPEAVKALAKSLQSGRGVSYKAALSQAREIVADQVSDFSARQERLQGLIERNAGASQATQRIAQIETELQSIPAGGGILAQQAMPAPQPVTQAQALPTPVAAPVAPIPAAQPAPAAEVSQPATPATRAIDPNALGVGAVPQGNLAARATAALRENAQQLAAEQQPAPALAPEVEARQQQAIQALNDEWQAQGITNDDGTPIAATRVAPSATTAPAQEVAAALGVDLVFAAGLPVDGVAHTTEAGVTTFVSADLPTSEVVVFTAGHEALHALRSQKPELYARYRVAINGAIRESAARTRQKTENANLLPGEKAMTIEGADEEVTADVSGNMWRDEGFWRRMVELDPSLFRQLRYRFMANAAKVMRQFKGDSRLDMDKLATDVGAVRELTARLWAEKATGQKLIDPPGFKFEGAPAGRPAIATAQAERGATQNSRRSAAAEPEEPDFGDDFDGWGDKVDKASETKEWTDPDDEYQGEQSYSEKKADGEEGDYSKTIDDGKEFTPDLADKDALQAELDAELGNANAIESGATIDEIGFEDVPASEVKAAGLFAESAFPSLVYQDYDNGTAERAVFRVAGQPQRAIIRNFGETGFSALPPQPIEEDIRGAGIQAKGLSRGAAGRYVHNMAASIELDRRGHDLAKTVTKEQAARILKAWKALAKVEGAFEFNNAELDERAGKLGRFDGAESVFRADAIAAGMMTGQYRAEVSASASYPDAIDIEFFGSDSESLGVATIQETKEGGKRALTLHAIDLGKGSGVGKAFYQISAAIARDAGLKVVADSDGLTYVNTFRRTEQMFSAALRSNDSTVVVPGFGQRIYGWKSGGTEAAKDSNLLRLALAAARNAKEAVPFADKLRYDPSTGGFSMDGEDAGRRVSNALKQSDVRAASVSMSTLARAAITFEAMAGDVDLSSVERANKPLLYSRKTSEATKTRDILQRLVACLG